MADFLLSICVLMMAAQIPTSESKQSGCKPPTYIDALASIALAYGMERMTGEDGIESETAILESLGSRIEGSMPTSYPITVPQVKYPASSWSHKEPRRRYRVTLSPKSTEKLKITLYYESLCPDCIGFIVSELQPTIDRLKDNLDVLSLDLVPYGKARIVQNELHCQHGTRECEGNKLGACAIDQLITQRRVPLQLEVINFITCTLMLRGDPLQDAEQCSPETGVNTTLLAECYNGARGDELIAAHGNRTSAVQNPLSWVPTIVINDKYDETENMTAQDDLLQVICTYLPNICK